MRVSTMSVWVKVRRQASSTYRAPYVGSQVEQSSQARRKSAKVFEGAGRVKDAPAGFTCTVTLV